MKNLPLYASAALGLFLAFGHPAQAQTIISANFTGVSSSMDKDPSFVSFDQPAGVIPAANFNNADGFTNGTISNVVNNNGDTVGGLSISYSAGTEGVNSPTAATPNEQFLNGFIASGTTAATTTISALPAGFGTYDLYVYLANATPSTGTYTYQGGLLDTSGMFVGDPTMTSAQTVMAATSIGGPFKLATATPGNYIEFTGLTAPTFQLSAAGVSGNAPINGFQIVGPASAAPEPSQVAALGVTALGLAGLIFRAKRRKASAV